MPEELINLTKLGKATCVDTDPLKYSKFYDRTEALRDGYHKYYWKIPYYAEQSQYFDSLYAYYQVNTRNGVVEYIKRYSEYETAPNQSSSLYGSYGSGDYSNYQTTVKDYWGTASGTVYITDTGTKYHRNGCRALRKSKYAISRSSAIKNGYESCGVCNP